MARAVARFTAADEAVVASISARLRARAFVVERDASTDPDCYWICREQSSNPIWVLLRTEDGLYQLRDELLGIECQGESLLEILPASWISTLARPDRGAVVACPMGNADHGSDPLKAPVARLGAYH